MIPHFFKFKVPLLTSSPMKHEKMKKKNKTWSHNDDTHLCLMDVRVKLFKVVLNRGWSIPITAVDFWDMKCIKMNSRDAWLNTETTSPLSKSWKPLGENKKSPTKYCYKKAIIKWRCDYSNEQFNNLKIFRQDSGWNIRKSNDISLISKWVWSTINWISKCNDNWHIDRPQIAWQNLVFYITY